MSERRIAIVTGGNGGLGTAICRALFRQGRHVVAAYYPPEESQAQEWQRRMRAEDIDVAIEAVDVSDFASCQDLVARVERERGPVEVLVNNAGITRDAMLRKMDLAHWSAVLRTNLDSVFNTSKQVFPGMCERGWGRIVNISSVNGQKGQFGQANYSAAKAGIHGFTMALAQEGARKGVTVNTVSPGYIGTDMVMAMPEEVRAKIVAQVPVGRLGAPDEIGRTVAFLTDDQAGFITGSDVSINGGLYMH
ncbi:MAG: beta-ketoacyl-ACP reductase [Pseudomonadota bacterium]